MTIKNKEQIIELIDKWFGVLIYRRTWTEAECRAIEKVEKEFKQEVKSK